MPAKTTKQKNFLEGCIHNPGNMRGKCPSKRDARRALGKHSKKRKS